MNIVSFRRLRKIDPTAVFYLIEKCSAEMFPVGKDVSLTGQICTAAVYQIYTGKTIFPRYFLSPQLFLDRDWIVRSTLHRRVVRDHDARVSLNKQFILKKQS